MKKILFIFLSFLFILNPAWSMDDSEYMSFEEYSRFFELGFLDDNFNEDEEFEEYNPVLKQKINYTDENSIGIDNDNIIRLNIEKRDFFSTYKEVYIQPDGKNELYKNEKFSLFSDGKRELSDYMTNNFKSTLNASYDFSERIKLQAGQEVWYVNPDARVGAKKIYFNPRVNLSDDLYLDYTSKFNQQNKNIEQIFGVNYSPDCFNKNANFGIKATTVINNQNKIQSQNLKFSSDFYIF